MTRHDRPSRQRPLPLTGPLGIFTSQQAAACGWTGTALAHAVATGRVERVRRGVYRPASRQAPEDPYAEARRALFANAACASRSAPRAVISHACAAIPRGLPLLTMPSQPCLTVPREVALHTLKAVHLHRSTLFLGDTDRIDGIPVTAPARTALDLAREAGVQAGLVAADAALRMGLVDAAGLRRAAAQMAGWPGSRAAGEVATLADAAAESPLESLSRLALVRAGLPAPVLQARIVDSDGRFVGRVDFLWPKFGVVGEADGNLKYSRPAALQAERRREQMLRDLGLLVVRWEWRDLHQFDIVVARLTAAFERGLLAGHPQRRWVVALS